MDEKIKIMVIKVDLQCRSCYKKIKKLVSKFPDCYVSNDSITSIKRREQNAVNPIIKEIRDQIYDDKQNTVTITVLPCCAERIRDKLYCKGGKTVKSIEIKPTPKPKEPEKKPKEPEKKPNEPEKKPKEPEKKPKEPEKKPKEPEKKPKEPEKKPKEPEKKPKEPEKKQEAEKPKPKDPKEVTMAQKSLESAPTPSLGYPTFYPCGGPSLFHGGGYGYDDQVGPCYQGVYGNIRPAPWYDNNYGHWGDRYASSHDYFNEENASGCTIM